MQLLFIQLQQTTKHLITEWQPQEVYQFKGKGQLHQCMHKQQPFIQLRKCCNQCAKSSTLLVKREVITLNRTIQTNYFKQNITKQNLKIHAISTCNDNKYAQGQGIQGCHSKYITFQNLKTGKAGIKCLIKNNSYLMWQQCHK